MPLSSTLPIHGPRHQVVRIGSRSLVLSFWTLQLGGWLFYGSVPCVLWLARLVDTGPALGFALLRPATGLLFSTLIRPLCRKLSRRACHPFVFLAGAALASLGLATADYGLSTWILWKAGWIAGPSVESHLAAGVFMLRWISLGIWIVLYFGIKQGQHSAVVDQANRESELALLQAQIQPHFLFNALNSIIAEAKDADKVRFLTHSLAEYLRFSLRQKRFLYPFGEEVYALQSYIGIQRIRFRDKLDCRFDVDPQALEHMVPSSVLQPLLENALKYGQRTSSFPLRILISASMSEAHNLLIRVENSGQWVEPNPASAGTGVTNLRRRLELIYDGDATLSLDYNEGNVVASMSLPPQKST